MASTSYEYQKPQYTYTLDQYIACQSDSNVCYNNLSFIDRINNIRYNTHNVTSDYIDELREEYCVRVALSDAQFEIYKYRPKLLCYDIYGNTELAFIILIINDICSTKEFTKKVLLMPKRATMTQITKSLMNSNKEAIKIYNSKNDIENR